MLSTNTTKTPGNQRGLFYLLVRALPNYGGRAGTDAPRVSRFLRHGPTEFGPISIWWDGNREPSARSGRGVDWWTKLFAMYRITDPNTRWVHTVLGCCFRGRYAMRQQVSIFEWWLHRRTCRKGERARGGNISEEWSRASWGPQSTAARFSKPSISTCSPCTLAPLARDCR